MKRKRKGWWEVTCFREGIAYESSTRKWKPYKDITNCSCSHARFKTAKRARQNALALSKRIASKVYLMHWFYHKGTRLCTTWTI